MTISVGNLAIEYIEGLTLTQGDGAGKPISLFPWERRFIRGALKDGVEEAALSVARGNGKTTLVSGLACAALDGPLAAQRGETVVIASSFDQARIAFEHVLSFMAPTIDADPNRWRVQDSANRATVTDRSTGARVRVLGSDPRRAHGLAPILVLADEPAQWPPATSEKMIGALRTSMGKITGARLVALGTRASASEHWFSKALDGGADYSQVHAAADTAPPFRETTWRRANPSLRYMPTLRAVIRREAGKARRDPVQLASFKALRLNLGVSDVLESVLLDASSWERIEGNADVGNRSAWGIDLGASAAMSALSCYWPETGRLDGVACFPEIPNLGERGLADGVGGLYQRMAERGELVQAGRRVSDIKELLREGLDRFGRPDVIAVDRWREAELRQELESLAFPTSTLVVRGQGFKDGAEDVREFRYACLTEGMVVPVVSLLMRSAVGEARTVTDPAGNQKLSKGVQGGRRLRARDDVAAAAILAVAEGSRRSKDGGGSVRYAVV